MINQTYTNQSVLNTSATIASISANVGTGFYFTSATSPNIVAVEYNTNVPYLSANAITPALTAYNAAYTTWTTTSGASALSAAALTAYNAAQVTLTSTINNSFSAYTYTNTAGLTLSSGAGTILVDRSYVGDIINFRKTNRHGFLAYLGATGTLTLTANGLQAWGPENTRLRLLGYF